MSNLPSKPELTLLQIMVDHPELGGALADFSELIMRGQSPFTPIERELVFAYISGLNQCGYCLASHKVVLRHFGVPETLVDNILAEVADPAMDEKMIPVLAFAKKLTQEPESVDLADAEAMLAKGWDEDAVTHLVYVCGLASLYNRLVSGMGIIADQSVAEWEGAWFSNPVTPPLRTISHRKDNEGRVPWPAVHHNMPIGDHARQGAN